MRILSFIVITAALISSNLANAQQDKINTRFTDNSVFYFNSFENGIAYFNDGGISKANFNYNVVYNDICYIDNKQILVINNPEELDSIKIENKIFRYIDGRVFETISSGKIPVLLGRKPDLSTEKPSGAYGTESTTSAASKKTSFYTNATNYEGDHCNIGNEEDREIPILEKYYMLIDNELVLATKTQINKQFKNNKSDIKNFINENNINIRDKKDLVSLASFLEKLLPEK